MEENINTQKESREEDLFEVVNRGKPAGEKINKASIRKENGYHLRCRIRAFWREVVEPAVGYIGLGAAMVAAMVLELAPIYLSIPVALVCCMWVAVRVDRFFRR